MTNKTLNSIFGFVFTSKKGNLHNARIPRCKTQDQFLKQHSLTVNSPRVRTANIGDKLHHDSLNQIIDFIKIVTGGPSEDIKRNHGCAHDGNAPGKQTPFCYSITCIIEEPRKRYEINDYRLPACVYIYVQLCMSQIQLRPAWVASLLYNLTYSSNQSWHFLSFPHWLLMVIPKAAPNIEDVQIRNRLIGTAEAVHRGLTVLERLEYQKDKDIFRLGILSWGKKEIGDEQKYRQT